MEHLSEIISAIGVIVCAWFTYNQYSKNKKTDAKIEKYKTDEEAKAKRRNDSCAIVYGELWQILHELKADRVYILQPHPLGNESMLTVFFEVRRKGTASIRDKVQNLRMSDFSVLCRELVKEPYITIFDVDKELQDKHARGVLSSNGCASLIVKKMSDNTHDWNGSIFCEFTRNNECVKSNHAADVLKEAATNIQYILPEIKE